jgi:uncharacterized cupin superfamily protein
MKIPRFVEAIDRRIAHQFYNDTDEVVDILMVGKNLP